MNVIYWRGPDLPYETEPKEYITVNNCDIGRHTIRGGDIYITERVNGRPDYYILYVITGKIEVAFPEKTETAYPGDVVVYYPNIPQKLTYYREDKTDNYWIHFTGYAVPEILTQCGFTDSSVYRIGENKLIHETFMQIMLGMKLGKSKLHINTLFMQLMTLFSDKRAALDGRGAELPEPSSARVLKAIMQITWERKSPRKIPYYAAMCGMSVSRFAVVFKKATGKTPMEFLEDARMNDAKDILDKSTLIISEIAEAVGYSDPLYFSRTFRKHFGVSPTEYRKRNK